METVIIPGGAGYLGRILAQHFSTCSYRVVILSREPREGEGAIRFVRWDGETLGAWADDFEGATAVVNLAGRSVNCRYTAENRRQIYDSRLRSTQVIGEAIAHCARPPKVWINSSSATIYRHALDRPMDETTGEIGTGFSVDVCQRWEQALNQAKTPHTRTVALRSAMVFGPGKDGVMAAFRRIVRLGLGGKMGSGDQYVSWIHQADFVRSVQWVLEHEDLHGPVNAASPNPLPNAEFLRIFRKACHQPIGLPTPEWMLKIGAFFLRTETELLLKSRRVVPGKLLASGFAFQYPYWQEALEDILRS